MRQGAAVRSRASRRFWTDPLRPCCDIVSQRSGLSPSLLKDLTKDNERLRLHEPLNVFCSARRVVSGETDRSPELDHIFYEQGPARVIASLGRFLARARLLGQFTCPSRSVSSTDCP